MRTYEIKPHPLAVWDYIKPLLFVWILPVVKRAAERFFLKNTGKSFFLEVVTIVAIAVYGVLKLKNYRIFLDDQKIVLKSGKHFRKEKVVYREGIFIVKTEKTFLNLLFVGLTVHLQLEGQDRGIKLRMFKTDVKNMLEGVLGE